MSCKAGQNKNDWSGYVVMIMGHNFCDDFVGDETIIAINISGILGIAIYGTFINSVMSCIINFVLFL